MVDTGPLDLANFLARNRASGGVNTMLADALQKNLIPQEGPQQGAALGAPGLSGLFGIGQENNARGDLGAGVRGGSFGALAGILSGGALSVPSMLGGLVLNDLMGNRPSPSITGGIRSVFGGGSRALSGREARSLQGRAEREDRRANRDLREGRGSGASPRRGDVSNAGR